MRLHQGLRLACRQVRKAAGSTDSYVGGVVFGRVNAESGDTGDHL
jgi:hypothetical protein